MATVFAIKLYMYLDILMYFVTIITDALLIKMFAR